MDRKDHIISNFINHIDDQLKNNLNDVYFTLNCIGLSYNEIVQYWESANFAAHPFQVWGLYYDENDCILDDDDFFGEFDSYEEAAECLDSVKTIKNSDAAYMTVMLELVVGDNKEESCLDVLEEKTIHKA